MKTTKKLLTAAAAAAVVLALAACAPATHDGQGNAIDSTPGSPVTVSPSASATSGPDAGGKPTPDPAGNDTSPDQAPDAPALDAASKKALVDAARATMTAYARPGIPAGQWYAELAPHLTADSAPLFQGVDPAIIPAHTVKRIDVDPVSTGTGAVVYVATDAGQYRLFLLSDGPGQPWLAEQINAPQ